MNLQSNTVSAALALVPVYPPKWITPVQPPGIAHGGLPLSAFMPSGVELIIDPLTGLLNWVVATYDVVTIFVNGSDTGVSKTIYPGEEGDRFLLLVAALWFKNGVNDVHYTVKRVGGNTDKSTTLQLLYNNPAPNVSVSHPASIGPGQSASITINVGYARPYDTVTLTIGTWSITFTHPDPTQPIIHPLTAAELLLIGDGVHPVFATVVDQLSNSGVSATTSITISANQQLIVPTLTNVLDQSNNEVPPNTTTPSTTLTLKGTAQPLLQVEVYDGSGQSAVSKGIATASALGDWQRTITVPLGARRLYAKSLYHPTNVYSNVRLLTVVVDAVVAFLNGPYFATAGTQVRGIQLLVTEAGKPAAGKVVTVNLPPGTTFPDGTSVGNFTTDANGEVALTGVTAGSVVGAFSIRAESGGVTASATLSIAAQTPVGPILLNDVPFGIAISPDGSRACVLCGFSLCEIDVASATVLRTKAQIKQGVGEIAYSPDGTRIYACQGQEVVVVDAKTLTTIAEIRVPGQPFGIVLNREGSRAYVSNYNGHAVALLDLENQAVEKTIPVVYYPTGIDISEDGKRVYVANSGLNGFSVISVIDTLGSVVVRSIPTNVFAAEVLVSRDGNSIFVAGTIDTTQTQNFVLQINAHTGDLIQTIRVVPIIKHLALNPAGTQLYCVGIGSDVVITVDVQSGQITGTTTVGPMPWDIAIKKDGTRGFVTCGASKTVHVIALTP